MSSLYSSSERHPATGRAVAEAAIAACTSFYTNATYSVPNITFLKNSCLPTRQHPTTHTVPHPGHACTFDRVNVPCAISSAASCCSSRAQLRPAMAAISMALALPSRALM